MANKANEIYTRQIQLMLDAIINLTADMKLIKLHFHQIALQLFMQFLIQEAIEVKEKQNLEFSWAC